MILWEKYEEILRSIRQYPITIVKSGHGVGKTDAAAIAGCWWLDVHERAILFTTSASWGSLTATLAPRIREKMIQAGMLASIDPNKDGVEISPHKQWISRSTRKAENAQGLHSENILQIVDEASGIDPEMAKAIRGNSTGVNSRQLWIANPIRSSGPFYDLANSGRPDVNVITISSLDHPNVITGTEIIGGGAVTREDIENDLIDYLCREVPQGTLNSVLIPWLDKWYLTTPDFNSRVLARFPNSSAESMIDREAIDRASQRQPIGKIEVLGVDVARSKLGDETVFAYGNRNGVHKIECFRGYSTMQTVGHIRRAVRELGLKMVAVDQTGIGYGVTDRLAELQDEEDERRENEDNKLFEALKDLDVEVLPIAFAATALATERFQNVKAEIHWAFKEQIEFNPDYFIPADPKLIKQCSELRTKEPGSNGKMLIEKKSDYKKRTGESPDRAEACIIMNHVAQLADVDDGDDPLEIYMAQDGKSGTQQYVPQGGDDFAYGESETGPRGNDYYRKLFS